MLTELAPQFDEGRTRIVFNFAASNTLRDQVLHGAEADVFVSAHPDHMDALESAGLLIGQARVDLLANRLVLVAPTQSRTITFPPSPDAPLTFERIAIAQPDAVPAGIYAMQALNSLGIAAKIEPLLVPALDVRAALAYAESGNVDAAIVYATDAAVSNRVVAIYEFPESSHSPIRYPAAVLRSTRNQQLAERFLGFLQSDRAQATYARYGFQPLAINAAAATQGQR